MVKAHSSSGGKGMTFPFFAGLGCGVLLSAILFFPLSSRYFFPHLTINSDGTLKIQAPGNSLRDIASDLHGDSNINGEIDNDEEIVDNNTIPLEVNPEPPIVQSLDWDINPSSKRIPGYLSSELQFKKKLFIGIVNFSPLTQRISKLIPISWGESWGREHSEDMTFYSALQYDTPKVNGFKYMSLSGISRLPDLPSPSMIYQILNDICTQYIESHHFYFIGHGNTYISTADLLNFTMHLNDSEVMWIGHGMFRSERLRHYTNDPDYYCHSGSGFILSRRSMQGLCPHLKICEKLYNREYERPGYELARCFKRFLNISCTKSSTAQTLFYASDFLPDPYSTLQPFNRSLTVHPVVDETMLYILHQYFIERQLNYTLRMNEYYYSIIQNMDRVLVKEGGMPDDRLVLGRDGNANKYHHPDIIPWDIVEKESLGKRVKEVISSANQPNPSRTLTGHDAVAVNDVRKIALQHALCSGADGEQSIDNVKKITTDLASSLSLLRIEHSLAFGAPLLQASAGDNEESDDISTGTVLRKVVPGIGVEYRAHILKNDDVDSTICVNQPYSRVVAYGAENSPEVKVVFVLPMQEGHAKFPEFMQMFEQACMSADQPQNVGLLVILYGSGKTNFTAGKQLNEKSSATLSLLNLYKQKYPKLSLRWINAATDAFSYIKAVEMAALGLPSETLICSMNLYQQMSPEFLYHIRLNTLPYERLFFPVSFQFFQNKEPVPSAISFENGFWRSFDYNTFCGYKHDFMQASGGDKFNSGSELFRKSLSSGLDVFRAPEYALVTKWHELDCDSVYLDDDEKVSCSAEKIQLTLATSRLLNS